MEVTEVFAANFRDSVIAIEQKLNSNYTVVSFDTEYPGCLRLTPKDASSGRRYEELRYNVEHTMLIQLGLTLSDEAGNVGGTWQFNLSDFDPEVDSHAPGSIALLVTCGIDFEKNKTDGISSSVFAMWMNGLLIRHSECLTWVTFHGLYDLGYLVMMVARQPLPPTVEGFLWSVRRLFGKCVYDLKVIGEISGFRGYGLERFAGKLGVVRSAGVAHQAGSDSLLTAELFGKLRHMGVQMQNFEGLLYGIDYPLRCVDIRPAPVVPCVRMVSRPVVYCARPYMGPVAYAGGWPGPVYGVPYLLA